MALDDLPRRRSIRLTGFVYRQHRAYFVTVCAVQKVCLFGEIRDGDVELSEIGQIIDVAWQDLPNHTAGLHLDAWVVMPNHLHGVVILPGFQRAKRPAHPQAPRLRAGSLGAVIGGFKSAVSREVSARNLTLVRPIWQRNYYERVIRDDRELDSTRCYIADSPVRWHEAPDHPSRHRPPLLASW